jgi:hypothetical protein
MKFEDHMHFDEWNNIFYGEEDKYEFQYRNSNAGILDSGGMPLEFQEE